MNRRIQGSRQTELDLERARHGPRRSHAHSAFRRHSAHCPPRGGQARRPECQRIAQVGLVRQKPMLSRPMRPSLPRKDCGALNIGCTFTIPHDLYRLDCTQCVLGQPEGDRSQARRPKICAIYFRIFSRRNISAREVLDLTSRTGSSAASRSCPRRTPRGAWPAASRWHWR